MHLHEYSENGIDILQLGGEIDMHFAPVLHNLLKAKAKNRCPALLLDVSGVGFIDSRGLSAILEYLRDSKQFRGCYCIGGVSEQLRWTFEVIHLDKAMPVFTDVTQAKEALASNCLPMPSHPLFTPAA